MSAAIPVPLATPAAGPTLREPYAGLDAGALLEHFRSRHNVQYFPVPDAAETTRERIDAICAGIFEFNGEAHRFSGAVDWLTNPSTDVEWHILLHKFYYAVGLGMAWSETRDRRYADRWAELIDSWIEVTPPGFIAVDVAGRRVQNWIYSLHYLVLHEQWCAGGRRLVRRLLHVAARAGGVPVQPTSRPSATTARWN
jgi:hypothetical protein